MTFLNQPYPNERAPRRDLLTSLVIGAFIFLFLLVFKPFGISEWQTSMPDLKIAGYGLISSLVLLLYYFVFPVFIPQLNKTEGWTVGYELLSKFLVVSAIAACNYIYFNRQVKADGQTAFVQVSFLNIYAWTFLLGIFPVTGLVCVNYIYQLRKYAGLAAALPVHDLPVKDPQVSKRKDDGHRIETLPADDLSVSSLENDGYLIKPFPADAQSVPERKSSTVRPFRFQPGDNESLEIIFTAENGTEKISLLRNELIYIEAEDNYTGITYFQKGIPVKRLLRSSLSRIESQQHVPSVVRCHRSFLVNLDQVERVSGNAQGYRFCIRGTQIEVPVGRKYAGAVQHFKAMKLQ